MKKNKEKKQLSITEIFPEDESSENDFEDITESFKNLTLSSSEKQRKRKSDTDAMQDAKKQKPFKLNPMFKEYKERNTSGKRPREQKEDEIKRPDKKR